MVSRDIQVYHSDLGDWYKLGEMETAAYCHCLAVLNDYLFVVGGQEQFDNNGNTATNYVYRFDPRSGTWLRMQSMLDSRTDFHVSVINGSLYAGTCSFSFQIYPRIQSPVEIAQARCKQLSVTK